MIRAWYLQVTCGYKPQSIGAAPVVTNVPSGPAIEDVVLPTQFRFNVGPASQPVAGSIPVYRLRRWPNTNSTLGLLYALSQHISKHMYQASSKCGVSKHLKHVRNSILSFLKHMLVFWNTYRSTSKCGISLHLTHVCNPILPFFKHTLVFWKTKSSNNQMWCIETPKACV